MSLKEVIKKNPDVSKFVILKTDLQRRGFILTESARERLYPNIHQAKQRTVFSNKDEINPVGLILRDGTTIVGSYAEECNKDIRDSYVVDVVDDKLVLTDLGELIEDVEYWWKPDYYDKVTSKGTPMWQVVSCRPQRLEFSINRHCHFWDKPNGGCKYCTIGALVKENRDKNIPALLDIDDIIETVQEALKQKGRFTTFCVTAGSILTGKE